MKARRRDEPFIPMADEIRAECEKIQARWDAAERVKRSGGNPHAQMTVPEVVVEWANLHDDGTLPTRTP